MRTFVRTVAVLLGVLTTVVGVWALGWPDSFSEFVNFPPHRHFVHDVGAFQIGLGTALLLGVVWADAMSVALAAYVLGGVVHAVAHAVDRNLGGSTAQTLLIGLLAVLAALALYFRSRELGWVFGPVGAASVPALSPFVRQKTVRLVSYRRDGTPVGTPVSIAVDGDHAYVRSFERAWKTRRIHNNPAVTVEPSTARGTPTGAAVKATARQLTGGEYDRASRALRRKHPLLHGVLVPLMHRVGRARTGRTVHFELTPL
jgi:PPOX class probable F420-dependent enzyme